MVVLRSDTLPLRDEADIVALRQSVRRWSIELGFRLVDQTKIVTAASELGRNTLIHGKGGSAKIEAVANGTRQGIRLCFDDDGPGIPDIPMAMKDGYSTGTGLGLGLSGSKRLMDEFDVKSQSGAGTHISVIKWKL